MKRSVVALLLCVTATACAGSSGGGSPTVSATPRTLTSVAAALAEADGHPSQAARYLHPLRHLTKTCASLLGVQGIVTVMHDRLEQHGIATTRLAVLAALAGARLPPSGVAPCVLSTAEYQDEIIGTGPARSSAGWGGYGGTVAAWNTVHHLDKARPGQYLPRRHNVDAYQLLSAGQVTSLVERFDPPIAANFALAQIIRDLLPGKVHVVYRLRSGQCQQAIYLGRQLGALLHDTSLGAFVELTSGGGVGHSHYDVHRVDRARISPLGAVGGQPCT